MISTANLLSLFILLWMKSSIVVAVGFVLVSLRRTLRISDRALWMMVFASIAVLPLLSMVLPLWDFPMLSVNHQVVQGTIPLGIARLSPIQIIAILWAAGGLFLLASLLLDHLRANRLVDAGERVTDERLLALLTRARGVVDCLASPRIVLTDRLSTPALVGLRDPVLLMPRHSTAWEDDELFAVMCHELFHLKRRDLATNIAERVITAILWLNPLVHAARRYSAFAREVAADRAALAAGIAPERLARRMIDIAMTGQADRAPAVALTFANLDGTRFETRIKALFSPETHVEQRRVAPVLMIACFGLMAVTVGVAQVIICVPEASATVSTRC